MFAREQVEVAETNIYEVSNKLDLVPEILLTSPWLLVIDNKSNLSPDNCS